MSIRYPFGGFVRALRRLVDALGDPAHRHRAILVFVGCYATLWTIYGIIAKSSQDLHADTAEMVLWMREPAFGYPKHPPFPMWLMWCWFRIFPLADWSMILFAVVSASISIYFLFELAGEWLEGEKCAAVPFLLAVIPFYNFLALRYDANSAQIPLWALTTWAFVRSLGTRHVGWAALAGLAAAAAILSKYWAAFLLPGLALSALADRRRNAYFRSPAPWVTAAFFAAAVTPHAIWLVRENFPPLQWIGPRRAAASVFNWLQSLAEYVGGTIGYSSVALLIVLLAAWPSLAAIRDSWMPRDPHRRTAAIIFYLPLSLPIPVAAVTGTALLSIWNMPALGLVLVMALASPLVVLTRDATMRIAVAVSAITIAIVLASPVVAAINLKSGTENFSAYGRLVAVAVEREWKETTSAPLRIVGGPFVLVSTAVFYMADRPWTYADFSHYLSPWIDDQQIGRDGMAMVCPVVYEYCLTVMNDFAKRLPAGRRSEVVLRRRWLFLEGPPERFVIVTVPPQP